MNILSLLFIFPNIVDIFQEIKTFTLFPKKTIKNAKRIPCETNLDCPFPSVCCKHPIFPIGKECCNGLGHVIPRGDYAFN